VAEALTNATKHAYASVVHVDVRSQDETLRLSIYDDGVGGADPHRGSGITGLRDRVEALGGQMKIASPIGGGTTLSVTVPIGHTDQSARPPLPQI
jgi:signal transduction histidine kinase